MYDMILYQIFNKTIKRSYMDGAIKIYVYCKTETLKLLNEEP